MTERITLENLAATLSKRALKKKARQHNQAQPVIDLSLPVYRQCAVVGCTTAWSPAYASDRCATWVWCGRHARTLGLDIEGE